MRPSFAILECLWASTNGLEFQFNKWALLYYGQKNPLLTHTLGSHIIRTMQSVIDHGVQRTPDLSYKEHPNNLIFRTNRLSAYILSSFVCRNPTFCFAIMLLIFALGLITHLQYIFFNSVELINSFGVQCMYVLTEYLLLLIFRIMRSLCISRFVTTF